MRVVAHTWINHRHTHTLTRTNESCHTFERGNFTWDVTHSRVWRNPDACVTYHIHVCYTTLFHVSRGVFVCVTWLIEVFICFICVSWLIRLCNDWFICATWPIHTCHVTYSCADITYWGVHMIHVCDLTHLFVWYDWIICATWPVHVWIDSFVDMDSMNYVPHINIWTRSYVSYVWIESFIHTCVGHDSFVYSCVWHNLSSPYVPYV